jgi:nucleotide-binding universal stress UspA family protein
MVMNKRILLGIDTDLSPPTQYALRVASSLLEESSPDLCLLLLHVIPTISDTQPAWGKSLTAPRLFPPTTEQRLQAEHALQRARTVMQQQGIAPERIKLLQRVGSPADEIVEAARELGVDFIVVGSRGTSFAQRLRRVVVGSTSRRVLRLAPCPIMLVVPPPMPSPRRLVAWYRESVTRSLEEHPGTLKVFTACGAAQLFAPPNRKVGSREVEAAAHALEELARSGVLCCHTVKGEVSYLND